MNFANLEKEISTYKELSKKVEQTLTKLALFFKTFSSEGILFLDKSKKSLDEFYQELFKENHTTTYNISFTNFYQDFKSYLGKIKELFLSIDKNISNKISEFTLNNQSINEETTTKLYTMLVQLHENKLKLEKYKHNYFDACKSAMEQEKKIKGKNNFKDIISKYETISENQKQAYKEELAKYNRILDENEEQYQIVMNNYLKEYQNKLKFLLEMMGKFIEIGKNYGETHRDILVKIERFIQFINIKRDTEYFLKDVNFINENKRRFLNEQFLDYEIFKKNIEKNHNDKEFNRSFSGDNSINLNLSNLGYNISYEKSLKILQLGKYNDEKIVIEGEENKKIDNYIVELLESEKELSREKYIFLLQYVDNNNPNITNFMDLLINHYKAKQFVQIKNLENLKILSKIICLIVSCSFNNKQIFDVCFLVMFVSEKTIYFHKDNINKFYLCKILPNRTVFSSINFWAELINVHIKMLADVLTRKEIENREKIKESNKNGGMFSKVKNIFGNKKDLENQRIENEILYGQIYDEKLPNYCVKVLNEYLYHFSNFNLEHNEANELIVDMQSKYKFDYSFLTYFMAELNSNLCITNTNKNENFLEQKEKKEKNNINKKIDYNQLYINRMEKKISKHITDLTMRIIIHSIKYLDLEELPALFAANKIYNKTLTRLVYKNLLIKLSKELEITKHILIWKILLNYSEISTKYNYEEIKEKISLNPKIINNRDTIEMDCIRTTFDTNNDLNQIKIGNILKALEYTLPKINYSQGMNYIAAFLLSITNNEEESFYLFLSLLISTEYGKLFEKDLEKLQKYFYVFDRLISILLPELHYHFKENNISSTHFLTPWLITLFTHIFNTIKDRNNPLILLRIFDLFIFSGWKSIIKIGITLLKNYELKLMNLTSEELLSYLLNNICKNVFFQNEYYDNLMTILINFKINSYLITNVENEYELKESIPKIGGKDIFES